MPRLFTIGHSRLSTVDFVARLRGQGVTLLVDVRAAPYSRRHPQFSREAIDTALRAAGIRYRWLGGPLGGLRAPRADAEQHPALAEPTFRAYAAHMADADFREVLARLVEVARRRCVALMCAEADPAQCHRRFIADALAARGVDVVHIGPTGTLSPHAPHPALRIDGDTLRYDRHSQGGLF